MHINAKASLGVIPVELFTLFLKPCQVSQWDPGLGKEARPPGQQALGILSMYLTATITRALHRGQDFWGQSMKVKSLLMHT